MLPPSNQSLHVQAFGLMNEPTEKLNSNLAHLGCITFGA
jgi:hypothetical protein